MSHGSPAPNWSPGPRGKNVFSKRKEANSAEDPEPYRQITKLSVLDPRSLPHPTPISSGETFEQLLDALYLYPHTTILVCHDPVTVLHPTVETRLQAVLYYNASGGPHSKRPELFAHHYRKISSLRELYSDLESPAEQLALVGHLSRTE